MASRRVLACSASGALLPREINKQLLQDILDRKLLNEVEIRALYKRFRCIAPLGWLDKTTFRESMGVLGLTDDPFIADRMFQAFGTDSCGQLWFREFAASLAVMLRGTEDEKLKLSFTMVAGSDTVITKESFKRLVSACNAVMASLAAPGHGPSTHEEAERLFEELASFRGDVRDGDAVLTLEGYKAAAQASEEFLSCLGLCQATCNRRTSYRISRTGTHQAAHDKRCYTFDADERSQAQHGHTAVPTSTLEELQDRLEALSRIVHGAAAKPKLQLNSSTESLEDVPPPTLLQRRRQASQEAKEQTEGEKPVAATPSMLSGTWIAKTLSIPWSRCAPASNSTFEEIDESSTRDLSPVRCTNTLDRIESELGAIQGICAQWTTRTSGLASPRLPPAGPTTSNQGARPVTSPNSLAVGQQRSRSPPAVAQASSQRKALTDRSRSPNAQPKKLQLHMSSAHADPHRKRGLLGPTKGLAVHFGHENWNMVVSMMIGMRLSIGRAKNERRREMQPVDFTMKEKFTIAPRSANIFDATASRRHDKYRFIDYAPMVFQRIRQNLGIQPEDYLRSVGPEQLVGNMILGNLSSLSEQSSEGKSGAFFYHTADGKYMLKTVSRAEYHVLRRMLRSYYDHLRENPSTLIVRFLGLHCLSVMEHLTGTNHMSYSTQKLYFVVMANMFNTPIEIHRKYDLKGSWVGRTASDDSAAALKKDVDFEKAKESIRVDGDIKEMLTAQIAADTKFLSENGIIDYSLLLGIHYIGGDPNAESLEVRKETSAESAGADVLALHTSSNGSREAVAPHQRYLGGMLSSDKKCIYFLGIIDMFKTYDTRAKIEHHAKAVLYQRAGVSCCAPELYASRFVKFMKEAIVGACAANADNPERDHDTDRHEQVYQV